MKNWKSLTIEGKRDKKIWNFIYTKLLFQHKPPHDTRNKVRLPKPNEFYDLSEYRNKGYKKKFEDDLNEKTIQVFQSLTKKGENMYATEWQHECYTFDPRLPFEKDEFDDWFVPIFANGDFGFFLTKDFRNGIYSDGLNHIIAYFGKEIIKAFEKYKPIIFTKRFVPKR